MLLEKCYKENYLFVFKMWSCKANRWCVTSYGILGSKFQNQINEITSFLDASMVYGSTFEEEKTLRLGSGGKKLYFLFIEDKTYLFLVCMIYACPFEIWCKYNISILF